MTSTSTSISLSSYTNPQNTLLFEKYGAFFAFSNAQIEESIENNVKNGFPSSKKDYVQIYSGLIAPKVNAKEIVNGLSDITKKAIAERLNDHNRKAIILYELNNFECFYTWDISDAVNALKDHGITESEIQKVFNIHKG